MQIMQIISCIMGCDFFISCKIKKMDIISSPLGSGAIAGFASCIMLQPLDLIKTRLQEEPIHLKWSTRLATSFNKVLTNDGWMGFWRGTCMSFIFIYLFIFMLFFNILSSFLFL